MNDKTYNNPGAFWSLKIDGAYKLLNSCSEGLNETEIKDRRNKHGAHTIKSTQRQTSFLLFLKQFRNSISSGLVFWQKKAAGNAIAQLLAIFCISANIIRNKIAKEMPVKR